MSLDHVISNLRSKELEIAYSDKGSSSEGLVVRDRSKKMLKWSRNKNRSKSKCHLTIRCCHCKKDNHIRKSSLYRKNKKPEDEGSDSRDSTKSDSEWILDSGVVFTWFTSALILIMVLYS